MPLKGRWLLAFCGIIDAMIAAMNLLMLNPDGGLSLRRFALPNIVWDMSVLALASGAFAISAGFWNSGRGNSWLLALHGLGLSAFGLIGVSPLVRYGHRLSFRPVSLLFVLMTVTIAAFALLTEQTPRSGLLSKWLTRACATALVGFAGSFIAVAFGWLHHVPPQFFWIWMSSFFAFTALSMLNTAVRLHGVAPSQPGSPPAQV